VGDVLEVIGSFKHAHYNSCCSINKSGLFRSVGLKTDGIAN
jgi:hypothetical protein